MPSTLSLRRSTLPNGMNVAYQSKAELKQFYGDIAGEAELTFYPFELRDVLLPPPRGAPGEMTELFRLRGFRVTVEQEGLYRGSDRYNLHAVR